jgi:hypothetical protein
MKPINLERILTNRYNHLLVMLIIFLVTAPYVERDAKAWGFRLLTILLLATLIICLRAVISNTKLFAACLIIVVTALVLDIISDRVKTTEVRESLSIVSALIDCFFLVVTVVAIMRSMFKARRVTKDMIVGGICVYLLIGICWTILFALIGTINPDAIAVSGEASYFYFSFTTLTTLGYGDVVPKSKLAQVLTNLEAITGQVYLAVFIARLVGLHIAHELKQNTESLEN